MHFEVFSQLTSLPTQIHWVLAIIAFIVGMIILLLRKGTHVHVALGRIWIVVMLIVSVSAVFVRNNSPEDAIWLGFGFSFIHLLIPLTLVFIFLGVLSVRRGKVKAHRAFMLTTFFGSLVLAGALTFLPGRHMHTLFFGDSEKIQQQIDAGIKK